MRFHNLLILFTIALVAGCDLHNNKEFVECKLLLDEENILLGKDSLRLISNTYPVVSKQHIASIYFNGTCSSCISKLLLWKEFIESNCLQKKANIEFIFYTENITVLEFYFKEFNIEYPGYFDTDSLFIKMNNLQMTDQYLFITDTNNRIIYKGNPLIEPISIKKLEGFFK